MIGHPKAGVGSGTWGEETDPKLDLRIIRITGAMINRVKKVILSKYSPL